MSHPRTLDLLRQFPGASQIPCQRYTEIFNRKAQSFRLQKKKPALILAAKFDNYILPTPPGYGIGANKNYYFSHMLNCIYDCRYCFLQGMYRSAHYVLFVNYDDFISAIRKKITSKGPPYTFKIPNFKSVGGTLWRNFFSKGRERGDPSQKSKNAKNMVFQKHENGYILRIYFRFFYLYGGIRWVCGFEKFRTIFFSTFGSVFFPASVLVHPTG